MARRLILFLLSMMLLLAFAGAAYAEDSDNSGATGDSSDTERVTSTETSVNDSPFENFSVGESEYSSESVGHFEATVYSNDNIETTEVTTTVTNEMEPQNPITGGESNAESNYTEQDSSLQVNSEELSLSNDLPLSTQDSEVVCSSDESEATSGADPYFTSGGNKYSFYQGPGSTDAYNYYNLANPIQAAIDHISSYGTIPTDGKIYVEKDNYTGNVTVDGLQPYLSGLKGLIGLSDSSLDYPTINGYVTISNLLTGFTLSGFDINGRLLFEDNNGQLNLTDLNIHNPSSTGMDINYHKGNIVMTRVKSSNNYGQGAWIDNSAGGNLTITNCAFNYNVGHTSIVDYGLQILSSGTVTIDGLSASNNAGDGLVVAGGFARLTIRNAVFNNNKITIGAFEYGDGLRAFTSKNALITLDTVYACDNGKNGIYLVTYGSVAVKNVNTGRNNSEGMIVDITGGTGKVNISNSQFYENGDNGLAVNSRGAITVSSIQAWDNQGRGAFLNNSMGSGNVIVTSPASAGHPGANNFSGSIASNGLEIHSKGSVTVTNINAWENGNFGILIDNKYGTGGITINKNLPFWENSFWDNGNSGMALNTKGSLAVSDSSSWNNGVDGIYVWDTSKSVSITRGRFDGNKENGLYIVSLGSVLLTDVRAVHNGSSSLHSGLYILNTAGSGSVTIRSSNRNTYLPFNDNKGTGIYIDSRGVVSISNIEALDNGYYGIGINNFFASAARAVSIASSFFELNGWNGVHILSKGAVTLTDVSACENGTSGSYSGVFINNTNGTGNVTVRSSRAGDYYHYSNNTGYGIAIMSGGQVSISNAIVSRNGGSGLYVNNQTSSAKVVNISRCYFDNNAYRGVDVKSKGTVSLVDVGASGNSGEGIYINNTSGAGNVMIRSSRAGDYYHFSVNGGYGVTILSKGVVSISNIEAANNGQSGINIINYDAPVPKAVSITKGYFMENGWEGVVINSKGTVTLTDVSACGNGKSGTYNGVTITNDLGTGNVTIRSSRATEYQHFSDNTNLGVHINSSGVITVSNAVVNGNNSYGMYLYNYGVPATAPRAVNITRSFYFGNKGDSGLAVDTIGHLTLDTVTASSNPNGSGAYLSNYRADQVIATNVTLKGGYNEFNSNKKAGLQILSSGNIYLQNVVAEQNGWRGIHLCNQYVGSTGSVTISASKGFWNSTSENSSLGDLAGLDIRTNGNVSITNLISANNKATAHGINIIINTPGRTVTLTNIDANNNQGSGIYISNPGPVTITNPHAYENKNHGIAITGNATNVTVRNTNPKEASWVSGNTNYGLIVNPATGHIIVSGNIYFNDNGKNGVLLNNQGYPLSTITISGITADHNNWCNLHISSWGNIILRNVTARDNDWNRLDAVKYEGVFLNNYQGGLGTGNISISGTNNFSNNSYSGLYALTNGNINISGVTATANEFHGIQAATYGTNKNIVLQNINVVQNGGNGLHLYAQSSSTGTITLKNVKAFLNGWSGNYHGIFIDSGTGNVYFTNCVSIGNTGSGIFARRLLYRLVFVNTIYFGNDADNSGDPDLYYL